MAEINFPQNSFTWMNVPFKSASEVKSLSGYEGCEKEELFHQSTVCYQVPWAVKLVFHCFMPGPDELV